jgi:hypothetical protein
LFQSEAGNLFPGDRIKQKSPATLCVAGLPVVKYSL